MGRGLLAWRVPAAWWVFGAILVALNLPNLLPWERSLYPDSWVFDAVERLLKCLLLASLFLSLFSRPWLAWLLSWVLFGWWMPVSLAVRSISDSPITSSLMGMAMASSPGELMNLLSSLPAGWVALFFAWNIFCVGMLFALRQQTDWRWGADPRRKIAVMCSVLLLIPLALGGKFSQISTSSGSSDMETASDPFAAADVPIGLDGDLPLAFPYELPWALAQYWQAREVVNKARAALLPVPAEQSLSVWAGSPDIVVLVVGESSSRSAWQLFNPTAPKTTPRLSARMDSGQGLYRFSNVVAQSTSTRQAVPSMLTTQPLMWPDGKPNPSATQSIVSLARQAGYATAWFSNQSAVGRFDGVIAAYADEAQTKAFLNPSGFFQQGSHDGVLLPVLQRHMETHDRIFVVLHTMGSHFRFDHRYPPGFGPFPEPKDTQQTYFNSVAYTDAMLDKIIEMLERDGRSAVMVYASDHGQGLAGDRCNKADVNRVTVDAYEVPALVWLSPSYESSNPRVSEVLRRHADVSYTTAAVYQTLRDLVSGRLGLENADSSIQAMGFLHATDADEAQMVVTPDMRWVNFKAAAVRDPCLIKAP